MDRVYVYGEPTDFQDIIDDILSRLDDLEEKVDSLAESIKEGENEWG